MNTDTYIISSNQCQYRFRVELDQLYYLLLYKEECVDYIKYSMDAWLSCAFIIRFAIQWDVGDHSEGLDLLRDRHQKVSRVGRG